MKRNTSEHLKRPIKFTINEAYRQWILTLKSSIHFYRTLKCVHRKHNCLFIPKLTLVLTPKLAFSASWADVKHHKTPPPHNHFVTPEQTPRIFGKWEMARWEKHTIISGVLLLSMPNEFKVFGLQEGIGRGDSVFSKCFVFTQR